MVLTVSIPESDSAVASAAIALAQMAPHYRAIESTGRSRLHIATFPDLSSALDPAILLVGEATNLEGGGATIDGRPIVNLNRFWSTLICYRDSCAAPDPHDYCSKLSARLSPLSGCPKQSCASHCQFICTRCLGVARETGSPPLSTQLRAIAVQAEVEWCPNLRLPGSST